MNRKRINNSLCTYIENSDGITKIQKLIENGADVNFQSDDWNNDTPLHLAVTKHNADIVSLLLEHGADISLKNGEGKSALDLASEPGNEEIQNLLANNSIQISLKDICILSFNEIVPSSNLDIKNCKVLKIIQCPSVEELRLLLQKDYIINAINRAPFCFFIDFENDGDIKALEKEKLKIFGLSKLIIIQIRSKLSNDIVIFYNETVNYDELNEVTINTESSNNFKRDPFTLSCIVNKYLVERKNILDIKLKQNEMFNGKSLLYYATSSNDILSLQFLMLLNWNLQDEKLTPDHPLHVAITSGSVSALKTLLNLPVNGNQLLNELNNYQRTLMRQLKDDRGNNLFMIAVKLNNPEVINFIKSCGFCIQEILIEIINADGHFPSVLTDDGNETLKPLIDKRNDFHESIEAGNLEIVKTFVEENSHLKFAFDSKNNSALKTAYEHNQYEIIAFLRSRGFTFDDQKEKSEEITKTKSFNDKRELRNAYLKYFPNHVDAHILQLVLFSRLNFYTNNKKNHFEQIREYFEELDAIPEISPILKLVANSKSIDIVFDFNNSSVIEIDPAGKKTTAGNVYPFAISKQIYVAADRSLEDILGTLIHELCHLAMKLVYENKCKPYKNNNTERETELKEILEEYRIEGIRSNEPIVDRAYTSSSQALQIPELIVRVPHMIAFYKNNQSRLDELRKLYKKLFDFFNIYTIIDIETLTPFLKDRTMIKEFNEMQGIYNKAKALKWNCNEIQNLFVNSKSQVHVIKSNAPMLTLKNLLNDIDITESKCKNIFLSLKQIKDEQYLNMFNEFAKFKAKPTFYIIQDSDEDELIWLPIAKLFKKHFTLIFILKSKTDEKLLLKSLEVNYQTIENIFIWSDLTEDSQIDILLRNVDFRGKQMKWNQILFPQSEKLQQISLDEILESSKIFDEIHEKKIKTYLMTEIYIPRKLISEDGFTLEGDEVMDYTGEIKNIVIAQSAGYGKTTTLRHFKNKIEELNPNHLIALIDLKQYAEKFSDPLELPFDESLMQILNIKKNFDQKLFQQLLDDGKMILMLDGFDEIGSDKQKVVLKFIEKYRASEKNQIWIATRTHFAKEIEKVLEQKSFELQPFTKENQINFLVRFWKMDNSEKDESKLTEIAEELIEKFDKNINYDASDFIGIPLQLRMIAELFKNDISNANEILNNFLIDNGEINIFKFYNFFIQKLKINWIIKCPIEFAEDIDQNERNESLLEFHRNLAITEMNVGNELETFINEDSDNVMPKLLSEHLIVQFGILHKPERTSDKNYEFVHNTFAGFFYAESFLIKILKNLKSQENLDDLGKLFCIIIGDKYYMGVVRTFINDALKTEKFQSIMKSKEFYKSISKEYPISKYDDEEDFIRSLYKEKQSNIYNLINSKFIDVEPIIDKRVVESILETWYIPALNDLETLKSLKALFQKFLHLDEQKKILLKLRYLNDNLCYLFLNNEKCTNEFFDLVWEMYAETLSKEEFHEMLTEQTEMLEGLHHTNVLIIAASYRNAEFLNYIIKKIKNYFIDNNKTLKILFDHNDCRLFWALKKTILQNVEILWNFFCEVFDNDKERKELIMKTYSRTGNNDNILHLIFTQKNDEVVNFILPKIYDIMGKEIFKEFLVMRNNEDPPRNAVGNYFKSFFLRKSFLTFIESILTESEIRNILIEENTECPDKSISKDIFEKTCDNTILHFLAAKKYLTKDEIKIVLRSKGQNGGTVIHSIANRYDDSVFDELWETYEETFNEEEFKEIVLSKNILILAAENPRIKSFHKCVNALRNWLHIGYIKLLFAEVEDYEKCGQSWTQIEFIVETTVLNKRVRFIEKYFEGEMNDITELLHETISHLKRHLKSLFPLDEPSPFSFLFSL